MATGRIPTTANSPLTAKGDLFTFSTGSAKLAVGNNGETLVADSSTATGLRWQGDYAVGKNKIINGDFGINQRSFTSTTSNGVFTFDRWLTTTAGTQTYTTQTFTPGAAPVAGYEGSTYLQIATNAGASNYATIQQRIEDVRTFAGQTVTVSFWARATSGTPNLGISVYQNFGSGGSSRVDATAVYKTLSTTWTRYTGTFAVPSISGKTIGTSSFLDLEVVVNQAFDANIGQQTNTFQLWGMQMEAGSVATAFQTATGTIQGELAACQRYFSFNVAGGGISTSITSGVASVAAPVTMRVAPTVTLVNGTGAAAEYTIAYRNITSIVAAEKVDTSGAMAITYNASAFTNTFRFVGTLGNTFSFSSEL